MKNNMNFEGAIFDLDGTLVDSLEDIADSMNSVLKKLDFPVHDLHTYKHLIGNGLRNLIISALPELSRDEQTIASCYNLMITTYSKNCFNKTKVYDGILDLLCQLKSRNIKLAVFSNKADEFTRKIVQAYMPGYFDRIVGLTVEAYKKPNPIGALHISDHFGISPENMLYLGDSDIDMQTAGNAGMYGVGALWGFRTGGELLENGAKTVIGYPLDLLDILENNLI